MFPATAGHRNAIHPERRRKWKHEGRCDWVCYPLKWMR